MMFVFFDILIKVQISIDSMSHVANKSIFGLLNVTSIDNQFRNATSLKVTLAIG